MADVRGSEKYLLLLTVSRKNWHNLISGGISGLYQLCPGYSVEEMVCLRLKVTIAGRAVQE